jgi:hypothetical protein
MTRDRAGAPSMRRIVAPLIAATLVASSAAAAPFTAGNVVVYRVGDGGAALANTGSPVFVDEFTPAGALVQSIALPTVASGSQKQLISSGTATSEGQMTRSGDGQYLIVPGYARDLGGTGSLSSSAAADVPRAVGRVRFDGAVDTSTALTDWSDTNNARSATSTDGTDLWVGGADGGVRHATLGSSTSVQVSTDSKNIRFVAIVAGQLYMSTQKGSTIRIGSVGTGTPTTAGQTITNLPGVPLTGLPDAFAPVDLDDGTPGVDTLYVADDSLGLQKFSLVAGSWTATGTAGSGSDGYRGVTASVSGATVTVYATRKWDSGGELVKLVDDSGYNGTLTAAPGVIASAPANEGFRGVALAPVNGAAPTPTHTAAPSPTASPTPLTATPTHPAPTATTTATPQGTATATGSPGVETPTPAACAGDCNGNGTVTVSELIALVNIALGQRGVDACMAGDTNHDGRITIAELLAAVNHALGGCPA